MDHLPHIPLHVFDAQKCVQDCKEYMINTVISIDLASLPIGFLAWLEHFLFQLFETHPIRTQMCIRTEQAVKQLNLLSRTPAKDVIPEQKFKGHTNSTTGGGGGGGGFRGVGEVLPFAGICHGPVNRSIDPFVNECPCFHIHLYTQWSLFLHFRSKFSCEIIKFWKILQIAANFFSKCVLKIVRTAISHPMTHPLSDLSLDYPLFC